MEESMKKLISEYYEDSKRAIVFFQDGVVYVEMFENDVLVEARSIFGQSIDYAQECAEDWVLGS